jgi:hypothetical protein
VKRETRFTVECVLSLQMAPILSFVVLFFILSLQTFQSAAMSFGSPQTPIHTEDSKAYDQFILFGDSITEQSGSQQRGFAFAPALQDGMGFLLSSQVQQFDAFILQ